MERLIGRVLQSGITHVVFAFGMMGSWAVYANWAHPMPAPVVAGIVQGALSGAITYGLKRALDALRGRLSGNSGAWLPPVIALSGSFCVLVGVHLVAGTPEVLRTIVVPFSVASLYAVIYNFAMWKREALHG